MNDIQYQVLFLDAWDVEYEIDITTHDYNEAMESYNELKKCDRVDAIKLVKFEVIEKHVNVDTVFA